MRRCYAHVPAAENPLRPEAPKSPWSRRILFPAPSGHFRIVPFLIGFSAWFLGLLIDGRFFFVLYPSSVSYGFVLRFSSGAYAFRLFFLILCVPMAPWSPSFFVVGFSIGGFMSFVRPQVSFIDSSASFSWLCLSSSFPVPHSFSLFRLSLRFRFPPPVLFPRVACVSLSVSWISIAVPLCFVFPFSDSTSVRSRRFIATRLQAEVDGPTGQGRPRACGGRPRGWRGGVGPGSRTRAAMGGRGRRRRGGRRPMGSAGRRTRRSR